MSEYEELKELVTKMYDEGLRNIHFDWVEGTTEDERIHYALEALKEVREMNSWSVEQKMLHDLKTIYVDVKLAFELSNYDRMSAWKGLEKPSYEELEKRLNKLHSHLDFALLHLGNWIERDSMNEEIKQQIEVNKYDDLVKYKGVA